MTAHEPLTEQERAQLVALHRPCRYGVSSAYRRYAEFCREHGLSDEEAFEIIAAAGPGGAGC